MQIKEFLNFAFQLRNLVSLRSSKNRKSCICCGFDGKPVLQKQIGLLLKEIGAEKDVPIPESLDLIRLKAKEVFPSLKKEEVDELVEALIFD